MVNRIRSARRDLLRFVFLFAFYGVAAAFLLGTCERFFFALERARGLSLAGVYSAWFTGF